MNTNAPTPPAPPLAYVPDAPAPESALNAVYDRLSPAPTAPELAAIVREQRRKRALWLSESEAWAKRKRAKKESTA